MKEKNLTISLNLPPIDPLPEGVQKYFNACQEKLGLVPNVLKAHSFNIDKLNAFSGLYNELMLADSNLSKLEREMIAVVVSSINRCFYCLTAHGAAVREIKLRSLKQMLQKSSQHYPRIVLIQFLSIHPTEKG